MRHSYRLRAWRAVSTLLIFAVAVAAGSNVAGAAPDAQPPATANPADAAQNATVGLIGARAAAVDGTIQRHVRMQVPAGITLTDVTPHMHYLGREARAVAILPDGERTTSSSARSTSSARVVGGRSGATSRD